MVSSGLNIPHTELSGRLQRLMFLRVVFVSILLGASVFMQARETKTYFGDIQTAHYVLIATIYFLTVVYSLLWRTLGDLIKLAYGQLLMDTLLVSAIIFVTGGIESIFSFLYILTIINGSILLYRKGGMIIASSSSILYGLLLDLHYYGIIRPIGIPSGASGVYQSPYIFYMILVNIAAFYVVAFLSSYPSEQARRSGVELQARKDDILKLEALNEWIIRSITSGLITLDSERRIILFNPAAEEILGLPAHRAIGKKVSEALPTLNPCFDRLAGMPVPKTRISPPFVDLNHTRADGRELFLRCSLSPLSLPEGMQKGEILFIQDLTEMKQIEGEMKRVEGLALIGELAAGIAHEVRNPLASISGSIQMLKEDLGKNEMSTRLMDIVLREIGRLNNLVSDFLLFARPTQPIHETFDLTQLVTESLALFKHRGMWTKKGQVETDFRGPVRMESDPEQIRQILWNLYVNACEAMPNGGRLYIHTESVVAAEGSGKAQNMVKMVIRDTGEGFSDRALGQLFTPFFTTKEGGTGLGLAIVKRIVEELKGNASGRNHDEGGAEVTILLPTSSKEENA